MLPSNLKIIGSISDDNFYNLLIQLNSRIENMEKEIHYLHDEIKTLYFKGIKKFEKN
jgi:uncharacterized protein (UPF0335 family)